MSVCGQTEEDSAAEEMGAPVRDIYEQKAVSKVVRVLTVLAYLLSVSLAAILLSVYYICVWKSPELPLANDTLEVSARRADSATAGFYHADILQHTGTLPTSILETLKKKITPICTAQRPSVEFDPQVSEYFFNPPHTKDNLL